MKRSAPSSFISISDTVAKRVTRRLIAIFAAGYGLLAAPNLFAYVLESGSPSWSPGNVTFQVALGSAGRTLTDGNTSWDDAASPAFAIWNQSIGSIRLVNVTNPSAPVSQNDGVNTVAFASTFFGSSFGSNTLAITGYYYSSRRMMEADILFNNRIQWDSYRGALRFGSNGYAVGDIRRVLIHELGHALGLAHPDQYGQNVAAVMNSVISDIDTAVQDDISGAQSIYGQPSGSPGPTPTPTPAPTPTPTPRPTPTPTPIATPTPSATPNRASASISVSTYTVRRGQSATFTISISKVSSVPVTVLYATGGTALLGRNYWLDGTPGQVTIPAGATSATVSLTAIAPGRRAVSATLFLLNGTGYTLSYSRVATVTITR